VVDFTYDKECVSCAVRTESLNTTPVTFSSMAAPWLWWSFAELSPRSPAFDPRSVDVVIVVNKMALIRVFVRALRLSL